MRVCENLLLFFFCFFVLLFVVQQETTTKVGALAELNARYAERLQQTSTLAWDQKTTKNALV